jgi:hypothetical protein
LPETRDACEEADVSKLAQFDKKHINAGPADHSSGSAEA